MRIAVASWMSGYIDTGHDEVFPRRIIPLPASFEEEYRAAWGIAECESESRLVGHDGRGRLIDPAIIRPKRRDLSAEEALEVIRTHCDNGLRYYTWALKRMPSIPEQAEDVREVENSRRALAIVLAYVQGRRRAKCSFGGG